MGLPESRKLTKCCWTCCQLGAREHYSIPRALYRAGLLDALLTDIWSNGKAIGTSSRWRARYDVELKEANVVAWNAGAIWFELSRRLTATKGWALLQDRNHWFQAQVVEYLRQTGKPHGILFSYSYTAEKPFEFAKLQGLRTVLGQIDPGPAEERLLMKLHAESPKGSTFWKPAPASYWDSWRNECSAADKIVVNSQWSKLGLLDEGIPEEKIEVIPLAFEPPSHASSIEKEYPNVFSKSRPLRILFLGEANLRKGMGVLMKVMERLASAPVEFWIVGSIAVDVPGRLRSQSNIRWEGSVPRSNVAQFYKRADVFIFPTFSDGFGITQLEAQARKLPLIASSNCGEVVVDGANGVLLHSVTEEAIEAAIHRFLSRPDELCSMSQQSGVAPTFGLMALSQRLVGLFEGLDASAPILRTDGQA